MCYFKSIKGCVLSLVILLYSLNFNFVEAFYLQTDTAFYVKNFGNVTLGSYTTPLPTALTNACAGKTFKYASFANINNISLPAVYLTVNMNSTKAQNICGTKSKCVVNSGVTLFMNSNLNVAALLVRGQVIWNDRTQRTSTQYLCAGYVVMEDYGRFNMSLVNPQHTAYIYLKDNGYAHPSNLQIRVFGGVDMSGGTKPIIDVTGRPLARTWSLMASAVAIGSRNITLAHNPLAMGWQIGDRIQLAPMTTSSAGTAETFVIAGMSSVHNIVTLSAATKYTYPYGTRQTESGNVLQMAAEVINLSRNIIFTGDDFRHVTCDPTLPPNVNSNSGCSCSPSIARMNCTMGLHTGMIQGGILRMQYTRVEKCGQRGVLGRYCIHMHFLNKCPQCLVRGNAIEFSQQRGIDIHQTHLSVTDYNVLSDVRGSNIFLEDGNEEYNYINYNVVICPWPIAGNKGGCSVPGTDYGLPDTSQDYSAFWSLTNLNYFIGNRAANAYSGLYLFNGNSGAGSAYNRVDPYHSPIGIIQGNTFHGGGKFGLYILSYFPKQNCTPSVDNNGEFSGVLPFCNIFTKDGGDIGKSVNVIDNNIYQQVFNGGYNIGDVQFSGMISVGNNNNLYWKETKNFQDGCAAHISNSYFESGNLAMPDNAAFIFENTQFAGSTSLETNHHCNVGNTGFLCMPTYVFSNVRFYSNQASWVQWSQVGNHYGGIFVLAPPEQSNPTGAGGFFPPSYNSLVSKTWTYLLASGLNGACSFAHNITSGFLGATPTQLDTWYSGGILCKQPLRALRVYTQGVDPTIAPFLQLQISISGKLITTFNIPFHNIGTYGTITPAKQGYAFPVLAGSQYQYSLSLVKNAADTGNKWAGSSLPTNWTVVFSDPVFGNRWTPDYITLTVAGQNCNSKLVSSQHDRRWLFGDSSNYLFPNAYIGGACSSNPNMPAVTCPATVPVLPIYLCESSCPQGCNNGHCDCGTKQCVCNAGFYGPSCQSNVCDGITCGLNGHCVAKYLGGQLAPSLGTCICNEGWSGPTCDQNPCAGQTCSGRGICVAVGDTGFTCQCEQNYSGKTCQNTCTTFGCGSPSYPFSCAGDTPGYQQICLKGGGCQYSTTYFGPLGSNQCCFFNCDICDLVTCPPATGDCYLGGLCSSTTGICGAQTMRPNGSPCNSVPYGQCQSGMCKTGVPTLLPSSGPIVSCRPTSTPSSIPSLVPTSVPSLLPVVATTSKPTLIPSFAPVVAVSSGKPMPVSSLAPVVVNTGKPTFIPSLAPVVASTIPSSTPSFAPVVAVSSGKPIQVPSLAPVVATTNTPSLVPVVATTGKPTSVPSLVPVVATTLTPSLAPVVATTGKPTSVPSLVPVVATTLTPSLAPVVATTGKPTSVPSLVPVVATTSKPTATPSSLPVVVTTNKPASTPSKAPVIATFFSPSSFPLLLQSGKPTLQPFINKPSSIPTTTPSARPNVSTKPS